MARSKWKFFFTGRHCNRILYFYKTNFLKKTKKSNFYSRSSIFTPSLVDNDVFIYKGNTFNKFKVSKLVVGFKFGEFSFSRKPFYFPIKEKKKLKR